MSDDIEALVRAMTKRNAAQADADAKKTAAFESLLSELSGAVADLVGLMESKPDRAMEIVDAIRGLKLEAQAAEAPQVKVHNDVAPTPVTVRNEVTVSPTPINFAPVIQPPEAPEVCIDIAAPVGAKWVITIPGVNGAKPRVATIVRTE